MYLIGCYYDRPEYTKYNISITGMTPAGIRISDQDNELNIDVVDRIFYNVRICITSTTWDRSSAWCDIQPIMDPIIVVPPDWYMGSGAGGYSREVFPCNVPDASCEAKGIILLPGQHCACRAIIQGEAIITAPDMELLPGKLTEALTGCDQIWSTNLAACGSPNLRY